MKDNEISIIRSKDKINVKTPYNKHFIDGVKKIGGKWNAGQKIWSVPAKNEDLLNKLLINTIGCDINEVFDMICVSYDAYDFAFGPVVKIGDFVTAEKIERDTPVRLSNGTAISHGEFYKRGGSAKYPCIDAEPGQVRLRSDIPTVIYDNLPDDKKALLTPIKQSSDKPLIDDGAVKSIPDRLRELRTGTGLSQANFAKKFNIPLKSYEKWERSERKPPEYVVSLLEIAIKALT